MATTTMGARAYEFLLSEAPGTLSREACVIASGSTLTAGAVLGRASKAAAAAPIPAIVGTGSGVMSALSFGPDVQAGAYVITLTETSATAAFSVVAPDGTSLADGAVGTAYSSEHLSFLISDGGTMTVGDVFTVTVTAGGTPVLVGTGTGVVSGVSLGENAQAGTYRVELLATSATAALEITAPDGSALPQGAVATPYTSTHINFTLANGGTMTKGDYFNLVVTDDPGAVASAWSPSATDGTGAAWGVLVADTDAASAAQDAVAIVRHAEVITDKLVFGAAVTAAEQTEAIRQLAANGIVARS